MDSKKIELQMVSSRKEAILAQGVDTKRFSDHALTKPTSLTVGNSGTFHTQNAINPLIAAAAPLLLAVNQLTDAPFHGSATAIYDSFIREVRAFEVKARKQEYRSAIILAARYFLCCYIDELFCAQEPLQQVWQKTPLLKVFQDEPWGGERFFTILERASDDPQTHVDLLEFGYLVLHLGYQGKYALYNKTQQQELENIKDNLYLLLKKYRKDLHPDFFLLPDSPLPPLTMSREKHARKIPHRLLATILAITGLCVSYFTYSALLKKEVKLLSQTLTQPVNSSLAKGDKNHA